MKKLHIEVVSAGAMIGAISVGLFSYSLLSFEENSTIGLLIFVSSILLGVLSGVLLINYRYKSFQEFFVDTRIAIRNILTADWS